MDLEEYSLLHITPHLGGGAGKAIVGLSIALKQYGVKSKIVLLEEPEKPAIIDKAEKAGISVIVMSDRRAVNSIIKESDVVVFNWWDHPLINEFLSKIDVECRAIIWCHTNGCVYPYLDAGFLLQFDEILFTSFYSDMNPLWTQDELNKIQKKRQVVYGFGEFNPNLFPVKIIKTQRDTLRIGYAGTLDYSKMHPQYIEYCDAIAESIGDVEFRFAGDVSEKLERDIIKSSFRDKYVLEGYVSDMATWYQSIDVFLYLLNPNHYGTTENSILEAMAYGLPIILMNSPSERFISGDGEGVVLVNDKVEIIEVVKKLASDVSFRDRCGSKSREFVCSHYSVEKNAVVFFEIVQNVMKKRKTIHDFSQSIGETPWQWFLTFTGTDSEIFSKYIDTGEDEPLRLLFCDKSIYLSESKSSINQFNKYFPEDENLLIIKRYIEKLKRNEYL